MLLDYSIIMEAVPMRTPNPQPSSLTPEELYTQLLEIDPTLRQKPPRPAVLPEALVRLERINTTLQAANTLFLDQARALYQALHGSDLATAEGQRLLARLKTDLNRQLQALDETSTVEGQGRKSYMTYTAAGQALALQTALDVKDYLLAPADQRMLEDCSRGPAFRPGMYALTFNYQDVTVAFAAAFVLTRQSSPTVDSLTTEHALGPVLLFTPSRGLEAFDSLASLDLALQAVMQSPAGRQEFTRHLPVRYQHLDVASIWPLELQPITGEPLFEHTYAALLDKRRQDVELAFTHTDTAAVLQALDDAIKDALPDLSLRLEFRAQRLLSGQLYNSLPDWYRNAEQTRRESLGQHLHRYNQVRQSLLSVLEPATTPRALAYHQLLEQLADELDIHDLDPSQLHLTTRRPIPPADAYEQHRSLVDLALAGLHTGDELPGSAFLANTTLTYAGGPLTDLSPQDLLPLIQALQPRLDLATVQKNILGRPQVKLAARQFFDQRLVVLACIARMQGHLSSVDFHRFEQLRANPPPHLRAQTVALHGAQLKDLWVLREEDAAGQVSRLLLCTPEAPDGQYFAAFNSLQACQVHVLAWAANRAQFKGRSMRDYLLEQVPQRFRPKMAMFLDALGFKPEAQEYLEVTFGKACNHADCLDAMSAHLLAALQDDYQHGTPLWYRSALDVERTRLCTLAEDAAGTLERYDARPDSEARFSSFDAFVHTRARLRLNALLGRAQNDVDPDSVFAYSPKPLISPPPVPISYTRLFRDGYEDGIGFINNTFSTSATFRGPPGIDLSPLTPLTVARSVTGVWVGQHYIDEIRKYSLDATDTGYAERRDMTLRINQLMIKNAALESRLQGHIASADQAWLERAIDSLSDTRPATRIAYKVHRLVIDGDWIMGVYLFSHADSPTLLYTPNAPDGIQLREARLFNYLLKKVEGMQAYLCARAPIQSQGRLRQFLENASHGLPSDINRSTPSPPRHAPINRVPPLMDLRHEFYAMRLQRKIDDVTATTVNRTQMISGILWTCVEWVTAIATAPFPALSLSLGGLLAFKDAMLALNAYHQGDKSGALQHYLGYLANLGGALLFDLRPTLKAAFAPVRPMAQTAEDAAESALIKQIDGLRPESMRPVFYEGRQLWTEQTPGALGRHLLYRQDPVSGQLLSTGRLVNQSTDGRWVRSGDIGGGRKRYESLEDNLGNPLAKYEIDAEQGTNFRAVLDPEFKQALNQEWEISAAGASRSAAYDQLFPLRKNYPAQVANLTRDTDAFFKAPPQTSRPAVPTLMPDAPPATVLSTLFGQNKRLIIGAVNNSIASKQVLIEHLPDLANQGLKRLYIENLPRDVFHKKLKVLNKEISGNKTRALKQIEEHLARVDHALGYAPDAPFTYRKLMLQARQHNVAIDGLDASSSYHMEHVLALGDGERFIPRASTLRNFYSHTLIELNGTRHPGENWIALVDHNRLGSYQTAPGLADLQGTLALRVEDAVPGQPIGVLPDTARPSQSRGDYRLKVPTAHHRLVQSTGAPPVLSPPSHYSAYDMPTEFKKNLMQLADEPRGLHTSYESPPDSPHRAALDRFIEIRQRLHDAAKAAFADYTWVKRPSLTYLGLVETEQAFIERFFKQRLGLIVGESHSAQSSKQFLIKHMKLLKKQGVKTLYVEHLLTDIHQADLDLMYKGGKMSGDLKNYLKRQDRGHMPHYNGHHTYTRVISVANKYGIRIRALDCAASYHIKGIKDRETRNLMFNYFANEVIKADQVAQGPDKWVAFMGSAHTDPHHLVPGIAQLQDAVSLHVRDVAPELARPLHAGAWETVDESGGLALRSDFKVEVGVTGTRSFPRRPTPDRSRLNAIGSFMIDYRSATETNLVHHSNRGELITTPIQIDDRGRFFIDRWEKMRDLRFTYLFQLTEVLKAPAPGGMGMRHIS
jgi:hypothetical protein